MHKDTRVDLRRVVFHSLSGGFLTIAFGMLGGVAQATPGKLSVGGASMATPLAAGARLPVPAGGDEAPPPKKLPNNAGGGGVAVSDPLGEARRTAVKPTPKTGGGTPEPKKKLSNNAGGGGVAVSDPQGEARRSAPKQPDKAGNGTPERKKLPNNAGGGGVAVSDPQGESRRTAPEAVVKVGDKLVKGTDPRTGNVRLNDYQLQGKVPPLEQLIPALNDKLEDDDQACAPGDGNCKSIITPNHDLASKIIDVCSKHFFSAAKVDCNDDFVLDALATTVNNGKQPNPGSGPVDILKAGAAQGGLSPAMGGPMLGGGARPGRPAIGRPLSPGIRPQARAEGAPAVRAPKAATPERPATPSGTARGVQPAPSRVVPPAAATDVPAIPGGRRPAAPAAPESGKQTKNAVPGGTSCKTNSFAAGTLVLMADGSQRPIDQVAVGDVVMNAAPDSGQLQHHVVTALHVTDDDRDFVDITVMTPAGVMTIVSTAHHLFWDDTAHTWTDVADLKAGGELETPGNGRATIVGLHRYPSSIRTYNLTVDGVHTYYVATGATPVLVHNCDELREGYRSTPAFAGDPYHPDTVAARSAKNRALYAPSVADRARELGYPRESKSPPFYSHNQPVFFNGKNYLTPDVDAHNVTHGWKIFDRRGSRLGTYDENLRRIKK